MLGGASHYLIWDIGTGDIRATVVSSRGHVAAVVQEEWRPSRQDRWPVSAAFDPSTLYARLLKLGADAIQQAGVGVDAVGVTSQRHGIVLLDKSGQPLVGVPNLGGVLGTHWKWDGTDDEALDLYQRFGRWPSPTCPAIRVRQLLDIQPSLSVHLGTLTSLSDWMAYELTGILSYDVTQASETLVMDLRSRRWDPQQLERLDLSRTMFPPIVEPGTVLGPLKSNAARTLNVVEGIPVVTTAADTQTAVHAVTETPGHLVIIAGTTTPVVQIDTDACIDPDGRTWTDCHVDPGRWLIESNSGATGLTYQWVRRLLYPGDGYVVMEQEAQGVTMPACIGVLGATIMDAHLDYRPRWGGLVFARPPAVREPTRADIAWAALWDMACAISLNARQVMRVSGKRAERIWGVGGGVASRVLTSMIASLLQQPVYVAAEAPQASTVGAAFLLSKAIGVRSSRMVEDNPQVVTVCPETGEGAILAAQRLGGWTRLTTALDNLDAGGLLENTRARSTAEAK